MSLVTAEMWNESIFGLSHRSKSYVFLQFYNLCYLFKLSSCHRYQHTRVKFALKICPEDEIQILKCVVKDSVESYSPYIPSFGEISHFRVQLFFWEHVVRQTLTNVNENVIYSRTSVENLVIFIYINMINIYRTYLISNGRRLQIVMNFLHFSTHTSSKRFF